MHLAAQRDDVPLVSIIVKDFAALQMAAREEELDRLSTPNLDRIVKVIHDDDHVAAA